MAIPEELIFPPVIIWDPYVSGLLHRTCVDCNNNVERRAWKLGQSAALEPRLVHDIDSIIVLVSSVYFCPNGHTYLTTDPRVLQLITPECVPFILLHRTGFLKSFVNKVVCLVKEGLGIVAIERFISSQRKVTEINILTQVMNCLCLPELTACKTLSTLVNPCPSNDIICKCFITEFLINQQKYNYAMSQIMATDIISFDHTFKVAANIGYLRSDGKWVTQYNSVMIVMNEGGQVMGWQFTKTTSMDEVKRLFLNIRNRIVDLEKLIIIADNCCSVKGKLSEVFGSNMAVKLDLFHAVQRVTKKLPKKHPMYKLCTDDLRLVFRKSTDLGYTRADPTADFTTILNNMDRFIRKWSECELHGSKIMNEAALKETTLLKTHIKKGCLSELPTGAGTNRNERLHQYLRPHFSHTRLGLSMALALMTILLYNYNCKVLEKKTGLVQKPIQFEHDTPTDFQFGIVDKEVQQSLWGSQKCLSGRNINTIVGNIDEISQAVELSSSLSDIITVEDIMNILEKALHLTSLVSVISTSSLLRYQFFPFMSSVGTLYFSNINASATSSTRLDSLIESWKMRRHSVNKDGNCCFVSAAIGLQHVHRNNTSLSLLLPNFNFDCTITLSEQLRSAVVTEWKTNKDCYSAFMADENDLEKEADRFQQLGFFASDLGDSVVHAIANAISMQLIVFTSQESFPVIHIPPRQIKCGEPIYLAFTSTGCGHYDAVLKRDNIQQESTASANSPDKFCTCGKNAKSSTNNCVPILTKYTTTIRCWCLRNEKKCTELCRCRSCDNQYGRQPGISQPQRKRLRYSHQIPVGKSLIFGCEQGEDMNYGRRSTLEFFVLEGVLGFLNDCQNPVDIMSTILTIYNGICDIACSFEEKLPIGKKNMEAVKTFLREHDHNLNAFAVLCNMQLKLSISATLS